MKFPGLTPGNVGLLYGYWFVERVKWVSLSQLPFYRALLLSWFPADSLSGRSETTARYRFFSESSPDITSFPALLRLISNQSDLFLSLIRHQVFCPRAPCRVKSVFFLRLRGRFRCVTGGDCPSCVSQVSRSYYIIGATIPAGSSFNAIQATFQFSISTSFFLLLYI